MFAHILVPLDGSTLAARALPTALALARAFMSRLTLLTILPPATAEADERHVAWSGAYLESTAGGIRGPDRTVTTAVRHGNAAEQIILFAEEQGCDLIAMCTHGRTGLERVRMGSVAQHVARHAAVPTLLTRPGAGGKEAADGGIGRVTVTLDGSPLAEEAMPVGTAIARALDVPLTLLRVLPSRIHLATAGWDGAYYYPQTEEIERVEERDAADYLAAVAAREADAGVTIRTHWRRCPANEVGEEIAAHLARQPGLAVVASHGRGGVLRWALGSTAEYLIQRAPCPVLIVRAGQAREIGAETAAHAGRRIAEDADTDAGMPPPPDAQAELWSTEDIAAELSHAHPHPITPGRDG